MPEFRKQGVGKRLIRRMAECFEDGEVVHVITFREFDYPCQRMVLKVEQIKG